MSISKLENIFAKKHQAVTYLVLFLEDAELLGYFSITIKPLVVKAEPFSNRARLFKIGAAAPVKVIKRSIVTK